MIKRFFWFIIGWFISIFSTHNYGWEPTLTTGLMLFFLWMLFVLMMWTNEGDDAVVSGDEQ